MRAAVIFPPSPQLSGPVRASGRASQRANEWASERVSERARRGGRASSGYLLYARVARWTRGRKPFIARPQSLIQTALHFSPSSTIASCLSQTQEVSSVRVFYHSVRSVGVFYHSVSLYHMTQQVSMPNDGNSEWCIMGQSINPFSMKYRSIIVHSAFPWKLNYWTTFICIIVFNTFLVHCFFQGFQ